MIQNLLNEVTSVLDKNEPQNKENERNPNILNITSTETDKEKICRVLHELLSPRGSHPQSHIYLKLFFEEALHIDISQEELETAEVYREYSTDQKSTIDLMIKTAKGTIPIEVKINEKDIELRYFDYREEILRLSFERDILNWLGLCLVQEFTQKNVLTREVIKQFMVEICQINDQHEKKQRTDVLDILMKSADNLKSAVEIANCVDAAKQNLIKNIFESIESKVNHPKLENDYDYQFSPDTIGGYYRHKQFECPGISYKYKENVKPNIDIWVRVEIEAKRGYANLIYVGYYCTKNGQKEEGLLSNIEIEDILKVPPWVDRWWAYYEYLPEDDTNKCPNFKALNEPFYKLFDGEYFNELTTKCAEKVKELLSD